MRAIAIAALLLIACKQDASKSKPEPVEPKTPAAVDATPTVPTATGCVVQFSLAAGGLSWTAGDRAGAMADGISDDAITDAVRAAAAAGPCTASIDATDTTSYQDVITVMAAAIAGGAHDVVLDVGGPVRAGQLAPGAAKPGPTITITTEAVKVSGTDVAKLDDPQLEHLLRDVLESKQAKAPGTTAVLQADKATTWKDLAAVIRTARTAGFTDLLFAVKNQ